MNLTLLLRIGCAALLHPLLIQADPEDPSPSAPRASAISPEKIMLRADGRYEAGDLVAARDLYQDALTKAGESARPLRTRCVDRLIDIETRVGQYDGAIRYWRDHQSLLRDHDVGRVRELQARVGESYLALRHYEPAKQLLQGALSQPAPEPIHPLTKISVLLHLSTIEAAKGNAAGATGYLTAAESFGADLLERHREALTGEQEIAFLWRLADCHCRKGNPQQSVERLEPLLAVHDKRSDQKGKRDTLRQLASFHAACNEFDRATARLREALEIHDDVAPADRLTKADLLSELGQALQDQGEYAGADNRRTEAARIYASIVNDSTGERAEALRAIDALWKVQRLYQKTKQYQKAIRLAEEQSEYWAGETWLTSKLMAEQASVHLFQGSHTEARNLLRVTLTILDRQDPCDLAALPRALNNLAIAELSAGEVAEAGRLGRRCLEIYGKHSLPRDETLAEAHNLLGACALLQGENAAAMDAFRESIGLCEILGSSADRQRSNSLLNLAWLHKSQRELPEAIRACREALEVQERIAAPDSLGFAWIFCAMATMESERGKFEQGRHWASRTLELCKLHEVDKGLLVIAAKQSIALHCLASGDHAEAANQWRQILALQEQAGQSGARSRTLNYLGITAELQGQLEQAESWYRQARAVQQSGARMFPVTSFVTLWRLANLQKRRGRLDEACDLLGQAVEVAEEARIRTYGADARRANFFAQFAPAFDQMVEWRLEAGDVEGAFAFAERGRSRSFVDQLRLAGIDPRQGLEGEKGEQLRQLEAELRQRINATRAKAQLIPLNNANSDQARQMLAELEKSQRMYAQVWAEILHASPVYRSLLAQEEKNVNLQATREQVLGGKGMLLFYYLGRERSYLLLFGNQGAATVFPLSVPSSVIASVTESNRDSAEAAENTRGVVRARPERSNPPAPKRPSIAPANGQVPLSRDLARALVEAYRQQIEDPKFAATRGVQRVRPGEAPALKQVAPNKGSPLPDGVGGVKQSATLSVDPKDATWLANILLPIEARTKIQDCAPEFLVLAPDGALHKLPFEALVLEEKPFVSYVLDQMPPIAYAPSTRVLMMLASRKAPQKPQGRTTVVTVGNPAYPQIQFATDRQRSVSRSSSGTVLGLRGQLPLLPYTATECRRIGELFEADKVVFLEGERASERQVAASLEGRRIIHLAAHGFVDEEHGNLFGAIALTPPTPGEETPDNDGFLSLYEIQTLPLAGCELAVLSACVTNVGKQRPLEAGVTIASAFLTAGARRVVASHWSVDDRSTSELMSAFFAEIKQEGGDDVAHYARALHRARRKVRESAQWSAPFFWAPFVLLGPPE